MKHEYKLQGGEIMNKFERTACCPKCGSVHLKVVSGFSKSDYICSECGEYIGTVYYDKYETLNSVCKKCDNDTFKVKISKADDTEQWTPFCSRCNEEDLKHYVDREGNAIEAAAREELLIKDTIAELINEVNSLKCNLNDVNSVVGYIDESKFDEIIYTVKMQIGSCNDNISSINDLLSGLAKKFNVAEK